VKAEDWDEWEEQSSPASASSKEPEDDGEEEQEEDEEEVDLPSFAERLKETRKEVRYEYYQDKPGPKGLDRSWGKRASMRLQLMFGSTQFEYDQARRYFEMLEGKEPT